MVEGECVLGAKAGIDAPPARCPAEATLYRVDIPGCTLHRFVPPTGRDRLRPLGQEIGCFALRRQGSGSVLVAMRHGSTTSSIPERGLEPLYDPETDLLDNCFDDSAVDPRGAAPGRHPEQGCRRRAAARLFIPKGAVDRVVDVPVEEPTGIAFGGPDQGVMCATPIRGRVIPGPLDRQPRAGGPPAVYGVGERGLPPARFAG